MLDFSKDRYVVAMWFLGDGETRDMLAMLSRGPGDPPDHFTLQYRFRHYAGTEDPFDDSDRKNWFRAGVAAAEVEAETKTDRAVDNFQQLTGDTLWKLPVHGDGEAAFRILSEAPFAHVKRASEIEVKNPLGSDGGIPCPR